MGKRPGLCLQRLRPGVEGVHGEGELRAEALPADHDGNLGRHGGAQPQRRDPGGSGHPAGQAVGQGEGAAHRRRGAHGLPEPIEAVAVHQNPVFEAAVQFARSEGIVPAPEPSHGIRIVIDEAIRCRERREAKTIAFVLCGHGHFDLGSYQRYLAGQLEDYELPQSAIDEALSLVPRVEA